MKLGLVSVTYRSKTVEEIIELTKKAGLYGIEWGGDIHVPHGDIENAKRVKKLTEEAGLKVLAYGSYYRVGVNENYKEEFEKVLLTAEALGADIIRIWAYTMAANKVSKEELEKFAKETNEIIKMANEKNIKVAFECHPDTLTEHYPSAMEFYDMLDGIYSYWQPNNNMLTYEENIEALKAYLPFTLNIHVFYSENWVKKSLKEGYEKWKNWISIIKESGRDVNYLFEFFPEETDEWLFNETKVMNKLLAE